MSGTIGVLLILSTLGSVSALTAEKLASTKGEPWCLFGMCIHGKKDYVNDIRKYETRDDKLEDLTKREAELEQWKKEKEEQLALERETQKQEAEAKKEKERDEMVAKSCQCTWECGDRDDGTVCFKKCCAGMFGGTMPIPKAPKVEETSPATERAPDQQSPALPAFKLPPLPQLPFKLPFR